MKTSLKTLVLLACMAFVGQTWAQKSRFYIAVGGGLEYAPSGIKATALIRPLLGFPRSGGFFLEELQFQMKNRFGVGVSLRVFSGQKGFENGFASTLQNAFPNAYTSVDLGGIYANDYSTDPTIQALTLVSYNIPKGKWALQPRLLVGATNIPLINAKGRIKQPNSNELSLIYLQKAESNGGQYYYFSNFTVGGGILGERRLSKRWSLFAAVDLTTFSNKTKIEQRIENQIDKTIDIKILQDKSPVLMMQLAAGIMAHW